MKKKIIRLFIGLFLFGFILLNIITYNHAYRFTHFESASESRTQKAESLSLAEKLGIIFQGVTIPRPANDKLPSQKYQTIKMQSHESIEGWLIPQDSAKGIVLLFHGYSDSKSDIVSYSDEFQNMGYSTFLIDFMGAGGSSGDATTIGFKEGLDVKVAFDYIKTHFPNEKVYLFGSSMGAAAILKAMDSFQLAATAIILECPFSTMLATTRIRFDAMGIPSFPLAEMLLFYGGWQTDFSPFQHKPLEYAKKVNIPTLYLYGAHDERVALAETNAIFNNIQGEKKLVEMTKAGHHNYLKTDRTDWVKEISTFLSRF